MLVPCYSHTFWLHQNFEQNFRYISHVGSWDLGFSNPKMPDPWWAKKFPWFSFKPCIDRETGNHFQKNFKPKKSKFDPKKHQNCNFYPKMKNGPWRCILCSIQPAMHFQFFEYEDQAFW